MSPTLQGQVAYATNEFWIKHVYFFRSFSSHCLAEIFQMVETHLYEPHEHYANPWTLYVLNKGLVGRMGNISSAGACWGQDQLLLVCFHLLEDFRAVAHTYAELLTLKRGHFEEVLKFFPLEQKHARRAHTRLAFSAGIRYLAKKAKEMETEHGFESMVEITWAEEKKHETDNKNVHLGNDDTNPDWDGFEHLNMVGMTGYKVDRLEKKVERLFDELKTVFHPAPGQEAPKFSKNDDEHNSGDSGEPLPEPGQSNLPENVVTWEGMRPFLTAVEKIERKMDRIVDQQAEQKKALDIIRSKVSVTKPTARAEKGWCEAPSRAY
jgi:hypothetical protein